MVCMTSLSPEDTMAVAQAVRFTGLDGRSNTFHQGLGTRTCDLSCLVPNPRWTWCFCVFLFPSEVLVSCCIMVGCLSLSSVLDPLLQLLPLVARRSPHVVLISPQQCQATIETIAAMKTKATMKTEAACAGDTCWILLEYRILSMSK